MEVGEELEEVCGGGELEVVAAVEDVQGFSVDCLADCQDAEYRTGFGCVGA